MAACDSADTVQSVQFKLKEVLMEFHVAHEAYHSEIKNEMERQEPTRYYNSLLELASELEKEINSWLAQPNVQRLLTEGSAHIFPEDSASNASMRDMYYTRLAVSSSVKSSKKFSKRKGEVRREKGCTGGESGHAPKTA